MFEYYKYKLANKLTTRSKKTEEAADVLGTKIWGISALLAITFSIYIIFVPTDGMITTLISAVSIVASFIWLITSLKDIKWQKIAIKLIQFSGLLLIAILLLGLLFSSISVLANIVMSENHHAGHLAAIVAIMDTIIQGISVLAAPLLVVAFFRFIDGRRLWDKIRRKTYLELLIIFALGLMLSQLPNAMVFRSLLLTQLVQFICSAIISTLLITAVITTCKNRGVLT